MSTPAAKRKHAAVAADVSDAADAKKAKVTDAAEVEDVVGAGRKHRTQSKKKKPNRVSKHIQQAAARKQAKVEAAAAEATGDEKTEQPAEDGKDAAAAPKPRAAKSPKPAGAAVTPSPSGLEAKQLALDYLRQWATAREAWKFQKVRQVFLIEHVYDKDLLPKKDFATFCDYIQELKGAARTVRANTHCTSWHTREQQMSTRRQLTRMLSRHAPHAFLPSVCAPLCSSSCPQRMLEDARKLVEEYQEWSSNAEARALEREARAGEPTESKEKEEATDADATPAADNAASEEEQDKKKKRKAQRAEKVLAVLS